MTGENDAWCRPVTSRAPIAFQVLPQGLASLLLGFSACLELCKPLLCSLPLL